MTYPVVALLVLLYAPFAIAATDPVELHPGTVIDAAIAGKQTDLYRLNLAAGEYANITVDQKGIDVIVGVRDADGKTLTEIDNEIRTVGQERTTIVADTAATYQLSVTPVFSKVPGGQYSVKVVEVRAATDKDRALFEAARLSTKSQSLNSSGKLEDARIASEHALELGTQALGPEAPYVGLLTMRVARIERVLGHYTKSREVYERAIAIDEAALGRTDPRTALAMDGAGLGYLSENNYVKAAAMFEEAIASTERALGAESPRLVPRLQSLAILFQDLEDKQSAIAVLEHALRICEQNIDPEEFQFTAIVNNLGTMYREAGDYARAEPMLLRALHMIEKKMGPDHRFVATPLQELGIIARETKHYDDALALLWRAEAAREKALGLRHPDTLSSLIVISNAYNAAGQYGAAIDIQQRVVETLQAVAGPYHIRTMSALSTLARSYAADGNGPCAFEYQTLLDEVAEKNLELNLAIGSERQKIAYVESTSEWTDRTISIHVEQGPGDESAAEHALLVLLQRKGRVLDAMADTLAAVRRQLKPEDRELLDRFHTANAELSKVALNGPGKSSQADYRAQLAKLESDKEVLEAAISARSTAFRAEFRPVTLAGVRGAIPADAALVEFSVYRPYRPTADTEAGEFGKRRYIAYVMRRRGNVLWKDLGSAEAIDEMIGRWRRQLRDPEKTNVDDLARALDRSLMQPVRSLTGDATHLLIAPDGQLALVPFGALVDSRGRYLVERYAITYLTSGRDLVGMKVPRPRGTAPVVIADPLFGEPSAPVKIVSAADPRRSITTAEDFSKVYFGPLAGTREEARSIHELFPSARVLTGKAATKSALEHLDAPRILHIATHGFFLQTTGGDAAQNAQGTRSVTARVETPNPLLRSGLALSGANLSGGANDGVITALEASTLDLWGTKLVTLSACDSGVGEVKNREGVYGLRRAFSLAGAETVVMSLWPVSDYFTRQMMTAYYRGLKRGRGRGAALRDAQLAMLTRPGRRHPFYWASFIQSGDWTALDNRH